jgi:hypothetical protein
LSQSDRRNTVKNFFIARALSLIMIPVLAGGLRCQETREITKTVELNADGRVSIDTYKGSITLETWEKPQVEISATIEPDGSGRRDREKVRDTRIQIDDSPSNLSIKTDYDRVRSHSSWFFGLFEWDNTGSLPFVHYRIKMPATASLKIKDYKSDTKIRGIKARLDVDTYKGTVAVEGLGGPVDLETYKGEASVTLDRIAGNCRLETYKGRIELSVPKDAGFELETDLGRRADFDSDFETPVRSKRHEDESHHATVNSGGPVLRISSEKGDIRIRKKI